MKIRIFPRTKRRPVKICVGESLRGLLWTSCISDCDVRISDLCGHHLRGFAQLKWTLKWPSWPQWWVPQYIFNKGTLLSGHIDYSNGMSLAWTGPESLPWGSGIENDGETDSCWGTGPLKASLLCGGCFFHAIHTQEAECTCLASLLGLKHTDGSGDRRWRDSFGCFSGSWICSLLKPRCISVLNFCKLFLCLYEISSTFWFKLVWSSFCHMQLNNPNIWQEFKGYRIERIRANELWLGGETG